MKKVLIVLVILLVAVGAFVFYKEHANAPQEIVVTDTPSDSSSPTPQPSTDGQPNITITSPKAGDTVTSPITVTGKARVFENQFNYVLKDGTGKKLAEGRVTSTASDSGQFGSYKIKIAVPAGSTKNLTIEVFDFSPRDGAVSDLVSVPVVLANTTTTTTKLYWGSNTAQCEKVAVVTRTITKTDEPVFVSIFELLRGPSAADTTAKFTTAIPEGVRINSLALSGTTLTVDFDETLQAGVAGSCRVQAIRAQITETAMQFASVKKVVISINGKTADILQP